MSKWRLDGQGLNGRQGMNVSERGVLETEHGLQETEEERESRGWARIKRAQRWI